MTKLNEWAIAQKIQDSNRRGIIIGIGIAVLVVLLIVIAVLKIRWFKKYFGGCDCDDCDEYYFDDDDDLDDIDEISEEDFA